MREIKFRGKTRITGDWVYGFYVERHGSDYGMIFDIFGVGTKVDKKTVGQFIGLKASDTDVYDGDIVEKVGVGYNFIGEVVFISGAFRIKIDGSFITKDHRVIGNIHDNPELLNDKNSKSKVDQ